MNYQKNLTGLFETVKSLRSKNGCPWDQKQTPATLSKYILEETEELLQGIINNDTENVCEELGDLLYLIIMVTETYSEKESFDFNDVIKTVNEKLIRRHPHVFGNSTAKSEEELIEQWKAIKLREKQKQ